MEVDNLLTLVILFFSKSVMLKIYIFRPDAIIGVFPSYCLTIISKSKNPKMNPCILFPVNFISNDELCFFPDTQTEGLRIVLGFFQFFFSFHILFLCLKWLSCSSLLPCTSLYPSPSRTTLCLPSLQTFSLVSLTVPLFYSCRQLLS